MERKTNVFARQNGITLVALVVTIVILLVLAVVSINLVLGQNGIVAKAKSAEKETLRGQENTQAELDNLYDELLEAIGEGTSKGKTLVQALIDGDIEVGDWVNYQNPTEVQVTGEGYTKTGYTSPGSRTGMSVENGYSEDFNQTYSLTNNGKQVNWRILGLTEDGKHVMLTTGSPLQKDYNTGAELSNENNPYFYLYGAEGVAEEYGLKELNKICAIYKNNYADEVRSLTIDDINRLCKVRPSKEYGAVYNSSDEDIDEYGYIGSTYTCEGQYASPEDYIAGTPSDFSKTSDAYYYEGYKAIPESSPLYDILFMRTHWSDGDSRPYWLASLGVKNYSIFCLFGPGYVYDGGASSGADGLAGLFYSDGREYDCCGGVRPVVILKSNVSVKDIQRVGIPTSGEDVWDYSW